MRQCCFGVSSIRNFPSAGVLSFEHHAEVGLETPRKLAAQGLIATGHVTARSEELVQGSLSRLVNRPRRRLRRAHRHARIHGGRLEDLARCVAIEQVAVVLLHQLRLSL